MDEFLKFDYGIDILSDSAGRALGGVISKFRSLKNVGYSTFTKMYNTCVTSVSDYFSAIWCHSKSKVINKVHNRAMRYFLGVPNKTPILAMQGDMAWLTSKGRHCIERIRLWNRLVQMNNDRLTKKVFLWDVSNDKYGWARYVKQLFTEYQLCDIYDGLGVCDVKEFKNNVLLAEQDQWQSSLPTKPKLRTYMSFKCTLAP